MSETMEIETIRYSDSVTIRAQAGTNAFVQAKARELGSKPAEITRQALLAGLKGLGFDPATASPSRDAGALYDVVDGRKRYALVTPAGAILAMSYHDARPADAEGRGVWLPVVHEDSEPFDIATHWRMAPTVKIVDVYDRPDRVVMTFPVVPKSLEAM